MCAEWNLGGFPTWLYLKPGCQLRANNEIYKNAMSKFFNIIIAQTRYLLADRGGPIIMSQVTKSLVD